MCVTSLHECYLVCLFLCMCMSMLPISMSTNLSICTAARIIEGPANYTVPIGATVSFHCLTQGQDSFLEINTTAINYPQDMIPFIEKGFSLSEQYTATTSNYTLTVNARPEINNTMITCWVPLDYRSGRLTVMGKFTNQ